MGRDFRTSTDFLKKLVFWLDSVHFPPRANHLVHGAHFWFEEKISACFQIRNFYNLEMKTRGEREHFEDTAQHPIRAG